MADATAGALTPETMGKLTTASATGRMLLATMATWLDREVGPAVAAVNRDTRHLDEDAFDALRDAMAGPGDPTTLADAMTELLQEVGALDLLNAASWARVRELAGEWLAGERPPQ